MSDQSAKPKLLVLLGPTAVGKTRYSLKIAQEFHCEIISGDSMQVYRGMDIGTAKATPAERQLVPHHLLDICDPAAAFSAAEFQARSDEAIRGIIRRGKLPFIVGGTGLYIESVCYGYQFAEGGADQAYREQLQEHIREFGAHSLHDMLAKVDPGAAARLHPHDTRRVIRALEIREMTGIPMTEHLAGQKKQSPYECCIIGLTIPRDLLYKRIEERVDRMVSQGLAEEAEFLLARGVTPDMVSMQGLGYKEMAGYVLGHYPLTEAVRLLKRNTRRFAKRQLSWFRHMREIQWVDVSKEGDLSEHLQDIRGIITRKLSLDIF